MPQVTVCSGYDYCGSCVRCLLLQAEGREERLRAEKEEWILQVRDFRRRLQEEKEKHVRMRWALKGLVEEMHSADCLGPVIRRKARAILER